MGDLRARGGHPAYADAAQPLCWEEAGHYYTVYYVALACGVPNDDAMRIAFWTQFPDEVSELDAVKAGFDMPRAAAGQVGSAVTLDTMLTAAAVPGTDWVPGAVVDMGALPKWDVSGTGADSHVLR